MFKILFSICFITISLQMAAFPQQPADRFMMAQFSKSISQEELKELSGYVFSVVEPLNVEKTLYKVGFYSGELTDDKATLILSKLPFFMASQPDGPVNFRAVPNDTFFSRQFHLNLIRAVESWNLTRSGVNRRGDTIVIAVIDDGLHVNHPDFQGNIWKNYADTAGNGIDDDSNGYVDDHYGWNFMNNNNDVSDSIGKFSYKAGHGTPVAGIIGAVGNNHIGISGIMWHVKLMIVNIADTGDFPAAFQSDALRAYSYVLQQRKLYNATGGQKGAFVVASNSSWGANGKFPHQAPLWCAMYDSLGKYGILNAIAISNNEGLIDTDGDLPTLCPSQHMIAVGASSRGDRFYPCGYSTTHVDLSATGHDLFSSHAYTPKNIQEGNLYGSGHSGTSFSSPMVAAAIGVLHSYACERILDSIKANPAKGNAMMRMFIIDGVDILPELNGKSATAGRLNIQRSLEIMNKYCLGQVGVNEPGTSDEIRLFPNPGDGRIQVFSSKPIVGLVCYDMTGKKVETGFDGLELRLDNLSDGVYFINIAAGEKTSTFKYIKTTQ
jgi:hypothetical protein